MTKFNNILTELVDGMWLITINRETKMNALTIETLQEIKEAVLEGNADPAVLGIVITGAGSKAFAAGADISEFANFSIAEGQQLAAEGQALLFDFVQNLQTPVIAAVNGFALGGGLELAMSCHFRIASTNAKMGLPEVTLGVIPGLCTYPYNISQLCSLTRFLIYACNFRWRR
jgi:enoyl-CoA hydratase